MNTKKKTAKVWIIVAVLGLIVLGGAGYAARSYGLPAIKQWRIKKMNAEAREFLTKGDPANALLLVRKSLAINGQNAEAWRIAVAAANAKKTAEVILYQENLCRVEPTKENYLELIRMALEFHADSYALDGIKAIAKEGSGDPQYHRYAIELYERLGRTTAAKYHLLSLISLAPNDRQVQLKLAAIEMSEDPQHTKRELRTQVRALADDPALRAQALSLLLREAVDAKMKIDTAELLGRLKSVPDLNVDKQLLLIEASMLVAPDTVNDLLDHVKGEVADSPPDAFKVLDFLRRTGTAKQAWSWYQKLPEKTRENEGVMRIAGDILFAMQDWPTLENFARTTNWGESNYLRQAFMAYTYRVMGKKADFIDAWKSAVIAAGSGPEQIALRKLYDLILRLDQWKWEEEHYDVLWKMFAIVPRNMQVRKELIAWERRQNHTANLNKIFATIMQLEPGDPVTRNNVAYTSLLLDSNLAQANLIADELVKAEPSNPYFVTTRSLALYKQGKYQEALEQIQSLGYAARTMPERMLMQALFLARAGDSERATDLLSGLVVENLLPEEKKLRDIAVADIERAERAQGNRTRLQAIKRGAESGGWLAQLDPATQHGATVDMQLADSAYASGDFESLNSMLRKADWGTYQYLNSALQTYIRRRTDGPDSGREQWKQTLVLADRDPASLQNLLRLISQWSWEPERIETLARLFERTPKDKLVLAELLKYYRDNRRLTSILKVLSTHLASSDTDSDERADYAYYCLVADQNTAQAQVMAKQVYDIEPDNAKRELVQTFSLWKQRRYAEAATLLKSVPQNVRVENVPYALIAAAVGSESETPQTARASLDAFDLKTALPEESALAQQIGQRISAREKSGTQ